MSYVTYGPIVEDLIELPNLTLLFLYEELARRHRPVPRLAGYSGICAPGGIMLGGSHQCRVFKDVSAQPVKSARDQRLDLNNGQLMDAALRMEAHLRRQQGHPHLPRRVEVPLPPLLVGFRASVARRILGSRQTPTLDDLSQVRNYFGLQLFPVSTVVPHLADSTAIFVDMEGWPRLRCIEVSDIAGDLCGRRDHIEFDFYGSYFRGRERRRRRRAARRQARQQKAA